MLRALFFGQVEVIIISAISDLYAFRSEGIMTRMEILKTSVGTVPLVAAFSKKIFTKGSVDAFRVWMPSTRNWKVSRKAPSGRNYSRRMGWPI